MSKRGDKIMTRERNISLDITRIIAIFAVVMIHVSGVFVSSTDSTTSEFFWGTFFDSVSHFGAPLFFMVSGVLMLDEKRNVQIKTLITKNIKNIVMLFFFWSIVHYIVYSITLPLLNGASLDLSNAFTTILSGHYHMWFLYVIIGLYLITPFLREFVRKENKTLLLLFFTVAILTQFLKPVIEGLSLIVDDFSVLVTFIENFHLEFFGAYVTYYILGWYLTNFDIKKKSIVYCCGIASLILTIVYVYITKDHTNAYSNDNLFILLYTVAIFLLLKSLGNKWSPGVKIKKVIEALSKLSFGVYITHVIILTVVAKILEFIENPFIYIIACFCSVVSVAFVGCFVVSKIPFVKKLIRA